MTTNQKEQIQPKSLHTALGNFSPSPLCKHFFVHISLYHSSAIFYVYELLKTINIAMPS